MIQALDLLANALGRLVIGGFRTTKTLPVLGEEPFELAQPIDLCDELPILRARLLVLEAVIAKALDCVRQTLEVAVLSVEEIVHASGLEAVTILHPLLLANADPIEAPLDVLERSIHPIALVERLGLGPELLDQLLRSHDAHIESGQLESVLAHPLERLPGIEAFHHQLGQSIESIGRIELELLLAAVPTAVSVGSHAL